MCGQNALCMRRGFVGEGEWRDGVNDSRRPTVLSLLSSANMHALTFTPTLSV